MTKAVRSTKNITIKRFPNSVNHINLSVNGSKNCALPILMYTFLLGEGNNIKIKNIPPITDIFYTLKMFKIMGGVFKYDRKNNELIVYRGIQKNTIPLDMLGKTRISVLLMSVMLVKFGNVFFPKKVGGCDLGLRPYDYHLAAFKKLGCSVKENSDGYLIVKNKAIRNIILKFKKETTTGTENALFLANFNCSNTVIKNTHNRPEILELVKFINKLGGNIKVTKNAIWVTKAQNKIENKNIQFRIIDDMEEALSYIALGIVTDSAVKLRFNNPYKYKEIEMLINISRGSLKKEGNFLIQAPYLFSKHDFVKIVIGPYPGFGSDAQPIMASIFLKISRSFKIIDTRFLNRFQYSKYYDSFNIKYKKSDSFIKVLSTEPKKVIRGSGDPKVLVGYDLRSTMSAVLTSLLLKEKVHILNADLVHRGYANFFRNLKKFKVKITQW